MRLRQLRRIVMPEGAVLLQGERTLPARVVIPAADPGSVCLRVAEMTLAIRSADPRLRLGVPPLAEPFVVPSGHPDLTIDVELTRHIPLPEGELLFNSGALWRLYRTASGYAFRLGIPRLYPEAYQLAEFDADFRCGRVLLNERYFPASQPVYPLWWPLDELLVLQRLARGEGVEVHGCGLIDARGEGHLFLGQSGAGKSTTARLWRSREPVTILSDDRLILRQRDGEIWMYGTPWDHSGRLSASGQAPLKRVLFLRHAPEDEFTPLSVADATSRLMACCFIAFHDPRALSQALAFFHHLAAVVPCYDFGFRPEATAVEAVLRCAEGQR